MKTLEQRIIESIKKGNIGISSLVFDVQRTSTRENEIKLLEKNGLKPDDEVNGVYSTYGYNKYIDTNREMWRELECMQPSFSEQQIKKCITNLTRKSVVRKKGWSENQIRIGNYSVELLLK